MVNIEIDNGSGFCFGVTTAIQKAEEELEIAEQKKEQQYETMKARIVVMYENDNDTLLSMLFESGSMAELLKRAEFIQSVHDYDRNELEEYVANIEKIESNINIFFITKLST